MSDATYPTEIKVRLRQRGWSVVSDQGPQAARSFGRAQLTKRLGFDLAYALARNNGKPHGYTYQHTIFPRYWWSGLFPALTSGEIISRKTAP